jgi:hypothetical protein
MTPSLGQIQERRLKRSLCVFTYRILGWFSFSFVSFDSGFDHITKTFKNNQEFY